MKFKTKNGSGMLLVNLRWQWEWKIRGSSGYARAGGHRFDVWTRDIYAGPLNIWVTWTGK